MIKEKIKEIFSQIYFTLIILVVFVVMSVLCVSSLRLAMIDNATRMGTALSRSYSIEEELKMTAYETLIEQGTDFIDVVLQENDDPEKWLREYLISIRNMGEGISVEPYVAIDGRIILATRSENIDDYDYRQAKWYQDAIKADGEIIYTDVYRDTATGKSMITIAKKCEHSNSVMGFDIFPENFAVVDNAQLLPPKSYYFLCDSNKNLLYYKADMEVAEEDLQQYVKDLTTQISEGRMDNADSYVYNPEQEKRAVYYNTSDNGWMSIVTIPYHWLIQDLYTIAFSYIMIFIIFLLIAILMSIKQTIMNRDMTKTNETIRILGNSYYAIYRIDFINARYEIIKTSDYVREYLDNEGEYEELLRVICDLIEPTTYQQFVESFSMENIRKLVSEKIGDYGGAILRKFNGAYKWVDARLLFDESLSTKEAVLCFRDMNEEKQQELQQMNLLKTSLESARQSEESRNRFFFRMSHDMRTPLNAIVGLSELAKNHVQNPEKIEEYLSKINISSKQLMDLINDILEISRLEHGNITLDENVFCLRDCVMNSAKLFYDQAEREYKNFIVDLELEDKQIVGDNSRLTQIINNLLSNAFKFTNEGGTIKLLVKEVEYGEYTKYQLSVSDTGCGMTSEFLEKIFEPYERETFHAKNVPGTGLGMPIVKNLVSLMGGQISIESAVDKGTTCTVILPFETIMEETEEVEEVYVDEGTLTGKKILLVEDNEINMEIAAEILQMNGMQVTKAWNGLEAVEEFEKSEPYYFDAVLMDMQMPKMGGCEATRVIRKMKRPDAKTMPIIAVTANAFAEDLAATTAAGMNAHISKPIEFSILCRTLEEWTAKK